MISDMANIYLIRHGESADNAAGVLGGRRDSELTEKGRLQAKETAYNISGRDYDFDIIYSSPLKRALETARIIAGKLGIADLRTDERLRESDFGILTGKPYSDIDRYASGIVNTANVRFFLQAEGAESFLEVFERCEDFLREIEKEESGKDILIVTHEGTGKMLRAIRSSLSWEKGLYIPDLRNGEIVRLD